MTKSQLYLFYFLTHILVQSKGLEPCFQVSRSSDAARFVTRKKVMDRIRLHASNESVVSTIERKRNSRPSPNARSVAIAALTETSRTNKDTKISLRRLETDQNYISMIDQRDRSFARNLVAITERRLGQIDKVLSYCCDGSYPPKKKIVQACLRVGVAQLLFLDTPHFAAVKETIDVLKIPELKVPSTLLKFANAVLRRASRDGQKILQDITSPLDNIAPWLLLEWNQCWGEEKTKEIVEQMMHEPYIYLTPKLALGNLSPDEQRKTLEMFFSSFRGKRWNGNENENDSLVILPNGSLLVGPTLSGSVTSWPSYSDGHWWVQDVSSSLPAIALEQYFRQRHKDLSKLHVVDFCAAPGGKTSQLIAAGYGRVTAIEASTHRSQRLVENLKRLNFEDRCEIVVSDACKWRPQSDGIAGILVDVPCSATGTGGRHPDVLRKANEFERLLQTQISLANHAADILPTGGIMLYSTCSLLMRESEDQVAKLLVQRRDLVIVPFSKGEIRGFDEAIDANGCLRILPGRLQNELKSCDGFFIARLQKL